MIAAAVALAALAREPVRATELLRLCAEAGGNVGVAALHVESGRRLVGLHENDRFPMQSVFKLPIALAVLKRADIKLDQPIPIRREDLRHGIASGITSRWKEGMALTALELAREMIEHSDNTACDVLLARLGGPKAVAPPAGIDISWSEGDMSAAFHRDPRAFFADARNRATPRAMVDLLATVRDERVLRWMRDSTPGPRRIKGALPPGVWVAHKTGTGPDWNGRNQTTNDVGLIRLPDGTHLAVAIFVSDSPKDEATRERTIARIARALYDSALPAK